MKGHSRRKAGIKRNVEATVCATYDNTELEYNEPKLEYDSTGLEYDNTGLEFNEPELEFRGIKAIREGVGRSNTPTTIGDTMKRIFGYGKVSRIDVLKMILGYGK